MESNTTICGCGRVLIPWLDASGKKIGVTHENIEDEEHHSDYFSSLTAKPSPVIEIGEKKADIPEEINFENYDPIGCNHRLSNGFTAWDFLSGEQGSGPDFDVDVHLSYCRKCGEIRIGGQRTEKGIKNRFNEEFSLHYPDAIAAIVKCCNWFCRETEGYDPFIRLSKASHPAPAPIVGEREDGCDHCTGSFCVWPKCVPVAVNPAPTEQDLPEEHPAVKSQKYIPNPNNGTQAHPCAEYAAGLRELLREAHTQLAAANALIKEKQEWIDSHI